MAAIQQVSNHPLIATPCPKCHGPMMFTGLVSGPNGLDVRTYECSLCNCTEKATVETK
jgi:hypothetical protein